MKLEAYTEHGEAVAAGQKTGRVFSLTSRRLGKDEWVYIVRPLVDSGQYWAEPDAPIHVPHVKGGWVMVQGGAR